MFRWIEEGRVRVAALGLVILGFLPALAQGQGSGTVTGSITDPVGFQPLASVQVSLAGLGLGALTNADGRFLIMNVPAGTHSLRAQQVGRQTREVVVEVTAGGTAVVDLTLAEEAVALEGLVVTALGVTREERALGYAVQGLQGEEVASSLESNLVNALAGQVAGVQVTNAGPAGGSSRIVLRGTSSIAGENQPLFVIDGIPVDNSSSSYIRAGRRSGGVDPTDPTPSQSDYGNAIQDLNSEDIESVTVLKGPNAAALYGARAANGAIVITTRKGSSRGGGLSMTATVNLTASTPLIMPTYQNEYGQGAAGQFLFVNGRGAGTNDGTDESWGPPLDGRLLPAWNSNGESVPFLPVPYNVRQFFSTGRGLDNHFSVSGATESAEARLSINRLDQSGMVPGHELKRTSVALNGGIQARPGLKVSGSGTYTNFSADGVPGRGYTGYNPLQGYIWFGRQVDTWRLREYKDEAGRQRNWNYNYHDNPYWESYERQNTQDRDRLTGHLQLDFQLTPWLGLTARSGTDWYQEVRKENIPMSPPDDLRFRRGGLDHSDIFRQESNSEVLVALQPAPRLQGDLTVSARVGANHRRSLEDLQNTSIGALIVPGVYAVTNAGNPPVLRTYRAEKEVNSVYGFATVGWRNFLFVDVTGRNDWSSTLPEENNSFFYPSISTSLVLTDLLDSDRLLSVFSFAKIRASWARVGNDAEPYQLASVLEQRQPFGSLQGYTISNQIPNSALRPETTDSWEFGVDLRSAGGRAGMDVTYYNSATTDQILAVQVSAASGYTSQVLNAGKVTNRGIEVVADVSPVDLENGFRWTITGNFARNRSMVEELFGDLESIVLGEFWGINVEARKGERYGALYGFSYERSADGQVLIDDQGFPIRAATKSVLGHYEPDFLAGLRNSFSYRGLEASFLLDWKQGGEVFSVTNMWGRYSGVLTSSLEGRETGIVIPGVRRSDGQPNTQVISADRWQHTQWSTQENNIYDASYMKLREVQLGFDLPDDLMARTPFQSARMSVVGRNLWLVRSSVAHIDPDTGFDASNFQGVEYGQIPSARTLGLTLRVVP